VRRFRDSVDLPEIVVTPQNPTPNAAGPTVSNDDALAQFNEQRFEQYDSPPFLTRAVVVVDGVMYYEWTSVEVRLATNETPPATFRLTVSEQTDPGSTAAFRIVPGDICEIFLDGFKIINGFVMVRQVYYDGKSHQVEIQGCGETGLLLIRAATSQTGEFNNTPAIGVISAIAGAAGVGTLPVSGLSALPLERHSITPGASAWEEIEKISRQIGAFLTEWPGGNLVIGDTTSIGLVGASTVIEGYNILEAREVIHTMMNPSATPLTAQRTGNDQVSGAQAAQMIVNAAGNGAFAIASAATRSLMELPGWSQALMALRARHENIVSAMNSILVTIGLVGWQRPGLGGLWIPLADNVTVNSPMLVLNNQSLMLKAVTYTQDNRSGTRATLELVNPYGLNPISALQ